ncbi:pirin family protein [Chitinophaga filiformis]|uniref:pirin family protein n=1 Tax=Chitinophaga filiformis TaxID=104663 RepID=UPI001F491A0C|nr:pirin family protein [Chitinophaga filiformis]MCF6406236.1 pirin family protein [Chitinophaga filiformis]
MNTQQIIQREIQQKWPVIPQKDTPIHKAGLVLPPGNWAAFDPFLVMAEDNMQKGAFEHHPHRGIETVTYMIDGVLRHSDNKGNKGELRMGDTQWMTAGKGLLHLEEAPENGFAHLLQLWVNLPAENKMEEPRYQDILRSHTPVRKEDGVEIRIISGSSGNVTSTTLNYTPVTMVEIELAAGKTVIQDFPADYNGFIYVVNGAGVFGANKVAGKESEVLWLSQSVDNPSEVEITTTEQLRCLAIAGKPLREPVVAKGPFVMNTEEQVNQAFKDLRDGGFGEWYEQKL